MKNNIIIFITVLMLGSVFCAGNDNKIIENPKNRNECMKNCDIWRIKCIKENVKQESKFVNENRCKAARTYCIKRCLGEFEE